MNASPDSVVKGPSKATRFQELLDELGAAHESEISNLTHQIRCLKAQVRESVSQGVDGAGFASDLSVRASGLDTEQAKNQGTDGLVVLSAEEETHDFGTNGTTAVKSPSPDVHESGVNGFADDKQEDGRATMVTLATTSTTVAVRSSAFGEDTANNISLKGAWTVRNETAGGPRILNAETIGSPKARKTLAAPSSRLPSIVKDAQKHIDFAAGLQMLRSQVPISPNSNARLVWDLVGMFLVSFDIVMVPLSVFSPPMNDVLLGIDYFILVFWTLDMIQSFVLCYWSNGLLEKRYSKIIPRYLRTWFLLDLVVVLPEWVLLFSGDENNLGAASRLIRGARFFRVLRLLRIMKLQRVLNLAYDMIDNEYTFIFAELVKMLLFIVVLNHVIACGWYGIGKIAMDRNERNWISWGEDYSYYHWTYRYCTSLHWSLTQFTPASMDVVARNLVERIYSIAILFFAMVAFSSIVATVTASMTLLRGMKNDRQKSFWLLRRYLKQEKISRGLSRRMVKFVDHQLNKQEKNVQKSSVRLLQHLSQQLTSELALEMYAPLLSHHGFFGHMVTEYKVVMCRLCSGSYGALKAVSIATGDTLFDYGEVGHETYVFKAGSVSYEYHGTDMWDTLESGEWIAEAVLWTARWRHQGNCRARAPSELLVLDEDKFVKTICGFELAWNFVMRYASRFVHRLIELGSDTDLYRHSHFVEQDVTRSIREVYDLFGMTFPSGNDDDDDDDKPE